MHVWLWITLNVDSSNNFVNILNNKITRCIKLIRAKSIINAFVACIACNKTIRPNELLGADQRHITWAEFTSPQFCLFIIWMCHTNRNSKNFQALFGRCRTSFRMLRGLGVEMDLIFRPRWQHGKSLLSDFVGPPSSNTLQIKSLGKINILTNFALFAFGILITQCNTNMNIRLFRKRLSRYICIYTWSESSGWLTFAII